MQPSPTRPAPRRSLADRVRTWIQWFGAGRLIAASVAIMAVAIGAFWLVRSPTPPTESTLPFAGHTTSTSVAGAAGRAATSTAPPATSASVVVVHVAGAVASPGVYHLATGSRVVDAVVAAGGASAEASSDGINLAAVVHDGERIYLPRTGEAVTVAAPAGSTTTSASGPIALNAGTAAQLDALPGVGPSTAAAIVAYREAHGPFASVDELSKVRGIGPAKLDSIRALVTV